MADEPKMKQWDNLNKLQKRIKGIDPKAKCYINLLPNIGKETLDDIGVDNYTEYVMSTLHMEHKVSAISHIQLLNRLGVMTSTTAPCCVMARRVSPTSWCRR